MVIGFASFATIEEPSKENISTKEKDFGLFIKNAIKLLKSDKRLQRQILVIFLSFSYLLSMPFVILNANNSFALSGWTLGGFITIQMVGSIIGSTLLWRKIHNYERMLSFSFIFMIVAFLFALFADNIYLYGIVFLLFGVAIDGLRISGMNLVIEIAPEDKRPIYTALQVNITSFALFFPILGGILLGLVGSYSLIYLITIFLLVVGLGFSYTL
jgi:MFS family permease